ncbi:hypothetical protein BJF90_39030 [Pseudonocardia sp. CNS-004]|nr:hypothetical protein BJF90_39030 [Pseudonocardia sp. CNS-004]
MTATAPAPPERPAVVAAAVLFVVLVCGTGAFSLLSEVVTESVERTSSFTPATDLLTVDADGDVSIVPSTDGQVHVRTSVRHGLGGPRIVQESTATGVRLDVGCREFLATSCDVRHEVQVPPAFEVVVDGSDGDVTATGLRGPLRVARASGDITAVDLTGPLDLRSVAGDISGDDLRSEVLRAGSETGDIRLEVVVVPREVDVTSTTGEIDLAVPAGTAYRVDADSDAGDERVLVPIDQTSAHGLRADSSTGDVTVRPTR